MFTLTRSQHNPILSPVKEHPWETTASFNASPVIVGKKLHLVYRAMSGPQLLKEPHIRMSTIACAVEEKEFHFSDRKVLVSPDTDFDAFGCEDPRVTKLGSTYYILYTALGGYPYSADNIKIAVAVSKDLKTITEKHLVTPFNAKAMALFPEKINGKFAALLTINTDRQPSDICYAEFDKIEDMWSPEYWKKWQENIESHKLSIRRHGDDHLELGAVPVKTKKGWVIIYAHIQKYNSSDRVFGIEALIVDSKNPRQIVGRTKGPFMVPDAYYEHVGDVPHTIFPSGALIRNEHLEVYYGAADTHCAVATIPLDNFLTSLCEDHEKIVSRFPGNPILIPRPNMDWEAGGVLNPAAIDLGGSIHILYRAVSKDNISTIGYAVSKDGYSIDERLNEPIYKPRASFENRGCEDPRIVEIKDRLYMTYTGYDGSTPRVAVSSISTKDFLARKFNWSEPLTITPQDIANKDAAILSEPINGRYMIFHRVLESICADFVDSLDFKKEQVDECIELVAPRRGMWDGNKTGIAAPPIKTKHGWLLLYHGVSWSSRYRVGAVLLDLKDPTVILSRTAVPLFEPEAEYELKGIIPNVVFPCGLVVRGQTAFLYYGGADTVVGVATLKTSRLFKMLEI